MRKGGTSFQELQKKAEEQASGASSSGGDAGGLSDVEKLQEMIGGAMQDPETMQAMQQMQEQFMGAFQEMAKMDPEEVQKQMAEAMKAMTDGSILDGIMDKKEEVLATLAQTGMVPPEELVKYKADPAYFEEQMRVAFDQMSGIFNNPEMIDQASQAMEGLQGMMKTNPITEELQAMLIADEVDDVKLEELRLKILQDPESLSENPIFKALAESSDFQEQLQDAKKWKVGFEEARRDLQGVLGAVPGSEATLAATGAGVGEL